jgi:hypothetical protein
LKFQSLKREGWLPALAGTPAFLNHLVFNFYILAGEHASEVMNEVLDWFCPVQLEDFRLQIFKNKIYLERCKKL